MSLSLETHKGKWCKAHVSSLFWNTTHHTDTHTFRLYSHHLTTMLVCWCCVCVFISLHWMIPPVSTQHEQGDKKSASLLQGDKKSASWLIFLADFISMVTVVGLYLTILLVIFACAVIVNLWFDYEPWSIKYHLPLIISNIHALVRQLVHI